MDETPISRGFGSNQQEQNPKGRVPPGQYVTADFPVLSAGPTSAIQGGGLVLALQVGGSLAGKWSWAEFEALPHHQDGHPLRHQMVEARYDLAGRDVR
jgi:hypothetical protein